MTFNLLINPILYLIICGVSLYLLIRFIFSSTTLETAKIKRTVFAIRFSILAILLFILANPTIEKSANQDNNKKQNIFLIDTSKSMSMEEPESRLNQAEKLFTETISTNPKIAKNSHLYHFDDKFYPKEIKKNQPLIANGKSSNLANALNQLIDKTHNQGIANIIVCSDGNIHDRENLGKAARLAKRLGIPISTYTAGDCKNLYNVFIENCYTVRTAIPHSIVTLRVLLNQQGGTENEQATLSLKSHSGSVRPVSKELILKPGITETSLQFRMGSLSESFTLQITTETTEVTQNDNSFDFKITVQDPKIKVLYMEGSNLMYQKSPVPPIEQVWAYEFMPEAWTETGRIEVDTFTVTEQKAEGGELYNIRDARQTIPTKYEDFMKYDVIICSDVNLSIFSKEQLKWVVELVNERGGGFCMIGGITSFGKGKWDKTIWEKMIPVDMEIEDKGIESIPFLPNIPKSAINHPIWQLDKNHKKNLAILATHPAFGGTNIVKRAKPGATVLATHSRHNDMPVICVQPYGKGRSMAFTSDSAGGWAQTYQSSWGPGKRNNQYYRKFWVNVVTWLAENSINRKRSKIIGDSNAITYKAGDTVKVNVKVLTTSDTQKLRNYKVNATLELKKSPTVELVYDSNQGKYFGELTLPDELVGNEVKIYFSAADEKMKLIDDDNIDIRIIKRDKEFTTITPNQKILQELAKTTGGKIINNKQELNKFLNTKKRQKPNEGVHYPVPLWDHIIIWLLIIALFTSEWIIRKYLRFA